MVDSRSPVSRHLTRIRTRITYHRACRQGAGSGSDVMKIRFNIKETLKASDLQIKLVVERAICACRFGIFCLSCFAFSSSFLSLILSSFKSGNHPRRVNMYPVYQAGAHTGWMGIFSDALSTDRLNGKGSFYGFGRKVLLPSNISQLYTHYKDFSEIRFPREVMLCLRTMRIC